MRTFCRQAMTVALLAALSAAAARAEETAVEKGWLLDTAGCKHQLHAGRRGDVLAWTGACVDGLAEGNGIQRLSRDGHEQLSYRGTMKQGRYDGQGLLLTIAGSQYEGEWVQGLRQGQGRASWASGQSYVGSYRMGKEEGEGELRFANGVRYRGAWQAGERNGQGLLTLIDGSRYEGNFRRGVAQGSGRYVWSNGDRFEGVFAQGRPQGRGVYTFADGARFLGEFQAGKPVGAAELQLTEGERQTAADAAQLLAQLKREIQSPSRLIAGSSQAAMVCTRMAKPAMPSLAWRGTVEIRARVAVRAGQVTEVSHEMLQSSGRSDVDERLQAMLTSTIRSGYECPGDHVFEQTFKFVVD